MEAGWALLERGDDLAAVRRVVGSVDAGSGAAALVSGPAGIGKTSLIDQVVREARDEDILCLTARGVVLEQDYGFGVVRQLFDSVPGEVRDDAIAAGGPRAAAVLGPHLSAAQPPVTAPPPDAVFATLTSLYWTTLALTDDRRVILAVDDLQWADAASLRFLDFISRRLESIPVVVLSSLRTGEPAHDDNLLGELTSNPEVVAVQLQPLSLAAVRQMVDQLAGGAAADEFVRACFDWTLGNPMLLGELFKTIRANEVTTDVDGAAQLGRLAPGALGKVVLSRLAHLGADATELCRAVAILGDGVTLTTAAAFVDLDLTRAAAAAGALEEAAVVAGPDGLHFTHPLLRAVVYDDMPAAVRGAKHLAAARLLQELGASPDQVAGQLLLAPPSHDPADAGVLAAAAGEAIGRGAADSAIQLFTRALAEPLDDPTKGMVLFGLAMAEASLFRPESLGHLAGAAELLPSADQRVDAELTRARLLGFGGMDTEALAAVDQARATLDAPDPERELFLDALEIVICAIDPKHAGRANERVASARELRGETPASRAAMAACAFELFKRDGQPPEVRALIEPLLQPDTWGFSRSADGISVASTGYLLIHLGQLEDTLRHADVLLAEAQQAGSAVWFGEAMGMRAYAQYRSGRLAEAEADARASLEISESFGLAAPLVTGALTFSLLARGEIDAAWEVIGPWQRPDHREDLALFMVAEAARGRALALRGDVDAALEQLRRAGEVVDALNTCVTELNPWRLDSALILASLDRRDEARALVEPALAAARHLGVPYGLGASLRTLALLEDTVDVDLLDEAIEVLRPSGMPLKLARVLIDKGAALRRRGHRRDAREPLGEGLELAVRSGATPLAELAQAEIRAAGGRPRRLQRSGVDALTPSERRVAQLAAEGRANREIAQTLFITPKTVETHLSSVFRKLGIRARGDLEKFDLSG